MRLGLVLDALGDDADRPASVAAQHRGDQLGDLAGRGPRRRSASGPASPSGSAGASGRAGWNSRCRSRPGRRSRRAAARRSMWRRARARSCTRKVSVISTVRRRGRQVGLGQPADQLAREGRVQQVARRRRCTRSCSIRPSATQGAAAAQAALEDRLVDVRGSGPAPRRAARRRRAGSMPRLGMVPAGQHLDADHAAVGGVHHRLEPGRRCRRPGWRGAARFPGCAAPRWPGAGPRRRRDQRRPPAGLGPIERHVGEALQVGGVGGVVREDRHADGGAGAIWRP